MKGLLFLFTFSACSAFAQNENSVIITSTATTPLNSSHSYIYAATMEIMWNELIEYLGEKPIPSEENATINVLNESILENYVSPLEEQFVVAKCGLVRDSIVEKINAELQRKFQTSWNAFGLPPSALVAYSYLQRDIKFQHTLHDKFDRVPFKGSKPIDVDCFGVKANYSDRTREDLLVHDYTNKDDFIVQIKSRDSLDEVYFAKIPIQSTLDNLYDEVLRRVNSGNSEQFRGTDILIIPYIQFDTTTTCTDLVGVTFLNEELEDKAIQEVWQRINFDLNPEGIKLKSLAVDIVDFADFENPPKPRILAFDEPFLIILKRKNSDQPYFLYWVSGVEFMRSYILKTRTIEEYELPLVGTWKIKEIGDSESTMETFLGPDKSYEFYSDGTYAITQEGYKDQQGMWSYSANVITLKEVTSKKKTYDQHWIVDDFAPERFVVGGSIKLVYVRE